MLTGLLEVIPRKKSGFESFFSEKTKPIVNFFHYKA